MLVWSLEANTEKELANQLASYIRRNFEVIQIVYSTDGKRPYKAFLLNKNAMPTKETEKSEKAENFKTLKQIEIKEEIIKRNLYEIECENVLKYKTLLEKYLYGNSEKLFDINDKFVFFELVIVLENKIILKNAYELKSDYEAGKPFQLSKKEFLELKEKICKLCKVVKGL